MLPSWQRYRPLVPAFAAALLARLPFHLRLFNGISICVPDDFRKADVYARHGLLQTDLGIYNCINSGWWDKRYVAHLFH